MTCPVCGYSEDLKPRSIQQLRLYWGMLRLVRENQAENVFKNEEDLHNAIKMALGYRKPLYDINGNFVNYIPESVAINKMDSKKFSEFFEKVKDFVFGTILPANYRVDFEKELSEMFGYRAPD